MVGPPLATVTRQWNPRLLAADELRQVATTQTAPILKVGEPVHGLQRSLDGKSYVEEDSLESAVSVAAIIDRRERLYGTGLATDPDHVRLGMLGMNKGKVETTIVRLLQAGTPAARRNLQYIFRHGALKNLEFHAGQQLTIEQTFALFDGLQQNDTITDMMFLDVNDMFFERLMEFLKHNKTLTSLIIMNADINIHPLIEMMKVNTTLHCLQINESHIEASAEEVLNLKAALNAHPALRELVFSWFFGNTVGLTQPLNLTLEPLGELKDVTGIIQSLYLAPGRYSQTVLPQGRSLHDFYASEKRKWEASHSRGYDTIEREFGGFPDMDMFYGKCDWGVIKDAARIVPNDPRVAKLYGGEFGVNTLNRILILAPTNGP